MSSGSEKQQLFFPEGNRKRLPGGICTGCIAFRAQDRRPICRALRLQQKDRVPGIRDDAQDAEGRAASAKLVADPEDRPVERAQQLAELELPLEVAVERGERLIQQDRLRLRRQNARQRHAPLLRREVDMLFAVEQHTAVQRDRATVGLFDACDALERHAVDI